MEVTLVEVLRIDLPALAAAVLASVANAAVGTWLLLRRQTMLGDAISHSVLPGIVGAFLLTGGRETLPMFAGALAAALAAGVLIEAVRRLGRLDSGTSMGVVFTAMFALGVVMIERTAARGVHLDAHHVLFGQLEDIVWLAPTGPESLLDPAAWADLPREVATLAGAAGAIGLLVWLFWKELKIAAFDPALATALGFRAGLVHHGLVAAAAVAAIASFEAVGSILVIAMLVCPPAAARLLTDRLAAQFWLGIGFAASAAVLGYLAAAFGPFLVGGTSSLNAAGMIAVVAGIQLGAAALLGPRHGALGRILGARRLAGGSSARPAP